MRPEEAQQLTLGTVEVFNAMEDEILLNVATHLVKHSGQLTPETIHSWQILQLSQLGSLTQANIITTAKYSQLSIDEVSNALRTAQYSTLQNTSIPLKQAVQLGLLVAPANPVGNSLQVIFSKYLAQAKQVFNLVNTTMIDGARQVYLDIVNQTVGKVVSGSQSPRKAMAETLKKWAQKGLPALVDKANRRWSPEGYLSMVTRSTVNNVTNESQFAIMDEYDNDLLEVSSHLGSRAKCAPYQGRIYSRSGKSAKYPPFSSTSYGEKDGLLGINCRHVTFPYIEGLSTQRNEPQDPFENDKAYQLSQVQRKHERDIRKAKHELYMMEALGEPDAIKKAKANVRDKQARMREFIKETGRTRRYEREAPAVQTLNMI